jgi:hypothetical protein
MISIGPITIDFGPILAVADNPLVAGWFVLSKGGWVVALIVFYFLARDLWYFHIATRYISKKLRPLVLAIDVPRASVQTPKGVENIFAHLAGAHGTANRRERHIEGKVQEWFSFEIVSIDGYIQFLIWTWDKYRDLVETAIYAQYPDAQISEVDDYTTAVPKEYPDDEWDLWGTEFVLVKDQAYPLRTWEFFEHKGQKDEPFKDPMAATLESFARLGPGEQIWLQFLLRPIDQSWREKSDALVKKLIGVKVEKKAMFIHQVGKVIGTVMLFFLEGLFGTEKYGSEEGNDGPMSNILHMSPGEREVVEKIEKKSAKIGFDVKMRCIYAAKKDVFVKQHGAHALIGSMKQFNTNDSNSVKPDFKNVGPSSLWLFKKTRNNRRKNRLSSAYRSRSMWIGNGAYVLNTEELATLWHFPTDAVHAPLIQQTASRRAQPPAALPRSGTPTPVAPPASSNAPPRVSTGPGDAPGNLPSA